MQVDLLWRRATGKHRQGKIFCLMNADLLGYDQADMAERTLEDRLQEASGAISLPLILRLYIVISRDT